VIRTIQADEDSQRMSRLFRKPPYRGPSVPAYPPTFPLPCKLRRPIAGGYIHVVYKAHVFAYGRVSRVRPHVGTRVGSHGQLVRAGEKIVTAGPLKKFPFKLPCVGFTGIRYTGKALHRLGLGAAGCHPRCDRPPSHADPSNPRLSGRASRAAPRDR
jgi:hypothetical protein